MRILYNICVRVDVYGIVMEGRKKKRDQVSHSHEENRIGNKPFGGKYDLLSAL